MKIFLAVDGSEAALHACRLVAAWQGDRSQHQLTLLNVQRPPLHLSPDPGVNQAVLEAALREHGEQQLEPARALLLDAGWQVQNILRLGPPADTLLALAREGGADALVMGGGRHGLLAGYAIGSVALRVAPAAQCPVLLVKAGATLPTRLGTSLRVTAPVDGSPESLAAVQRLARCAGLLGTLHVDLVHFRPSLSLGAAMLPPHDDVLSQWGGRESDVALAAPAEALGVAGIPFELHRLAGTPEVAIAAFAREHGADLIAMATRGRGAMHHLVLGSVALRTAHQSAVPVALMR
ncbi:MAG: universal stress protein [Ramlibacter sp.]|jgi:nucleotide-binding universal stress UspA family protein|uniref:universal stress protein n=1 Tax=Ramlibacter sp. TaxID=1917967 RepID=UPI00261D3CC3|nr:universal stress protein [Ramlibacter sp.]MDB5752453.1 universal stress protein [Ramlibacter sp.]